MKIKIKKIFLGEGILNWDRTERVSDRYGTVKLFLSLNLDENIAFDTVEAGKSGRLIAVVKEIRKSDHIGDLFYGIRPVMPKKGEKIILGEGILFYEGIFAVGVKPKNERQSLWLDIKKLYRAHLQTVCLYFEKYE